MTNDTLRADRAEANLTKANRIIRQMYAALEYQERFVLGTILDGQVRQYLATQESEE